MVWIDDSVRAEEPQCRRERPRLTGPFRYPSWPGCTTWGGAGRGGKPVLYDVGVRFELIRMAGQRCWRSRDEGPDRPNSADRRRLGMCHRLDSLGTSMRRLT